MGVDLLRFAVCLGGPLCGCDLLARNGRRVGTLVFGGGEGARASVRWADCC